MGSDSDIAAVSGQSDRKRGPDAKQRTNLVVHEIIRWGGFVRDEIGSEPVDGPINEKAPIYASATLQGERKG